MKRDNLQLFNPYLSKKSDTELYEIRRTLAKRLNQRMRRLEQAGIEYGAIKKYKQEVARYYAGKKGFTESRGKTKGLTVKHEISLIQNLLNLPTSTLPGIKKIRKKAMNTFEEKYNVHFKNVQEYEDFIESDTWKKMDQLYGSGSALDLIAVSGKTIEQVRKAVETFIAKTDKYKSEDIAKQLGFKSLKEALKKPKQTGVIRTWK